MNGCSYPRGSETFYGGILQQIPFVWNIAGWLPIAMDIIFYFEASIFAPKKSREKTMASSRFMLMAASNGN